MAFQEEVAAKRVISIKPLCWREVRERKNFRKKIWQQKAKTFQWYRVDRSIGCYRDPNLIDRIHQQSRWHDFCKPSKMWKKSSIAYKKKKNKKKKKKKKKKIAARLFSRSLWQLFLFIVE